MDEPKTAKDIFDACLTIEEGKKFPDVAVSFTLSPFDVSDPSTQTITVSDTWFRFIKSEDYLEIDLIFKANTDPRLNKALRFISEWEEKTVNEEPMLLQLDIIPFKYRANYIISAEQPLLYALCSDKVDEYPRMLKMIFEEDYVKIVKTDGVDFNDLMAQIKRELDREEKEELAMLKEREKEEYEAFHSDFINGGTL